MSEQVIIGLDIGGTNIRIGNRARNQQLQGFEKVARDAVLDPSATASSLSDFIQDYIKRHALSGRVLAVAAGFPSTLSADRRTILQTPNIPAMDNLPIADILEKELGFKAILDRDVNFIFAWDCSSLKLDWTGVCAGIYFGTGIGNAIFFDGKPLVGRDGCAGEIGHIPIAGRQDPCGCGNMGCSECYASGTRLAAIRDSCFPQVPIQDLFTLHREEAVLVEFIDEMACVAATEINLLNPSFIVLGGGVLAMQDFPKDLLEDRIHGHCRKPFPDQTLQIYYSTESQQAGVLGALSQAWKSLGGKTC